MEIRCPQRRREPIIQSFLEALRDADLEEYVRGLLLCFGAPTIRGLKAASLINLRRADKSDVSFDGEDVRSLWNARGAEWLAPFGVEWVLLNEGTAERNALVMIYRRELLERALNDPAATEILRALGYPLPELDACLDYLLGRYRSEFPHEIGLFLDYPPEDVKGFMEDGGAKSLAVGYWKVYGNVRKARRTFRRYRRAERDAARMLMSGKNLWKNGDRSLFPSEWSR